MRTATALGLAGVRRNAEGAAADGRAEHIKICTGREELKDFCCGQRDGPSAEKFLQSLEATGRCSC